MTTNVALNSNDVVSEKKTLNFVKCEIPKCYFIKKIKNQ